MSTPASDFCQRWRERRHAWRHRSEGGFDRARYRVDLVDEPAAKTFVERHHYSRSYPAARIRTGLFRRDGEQLVGVSILSVPVQATVLTSVFPALEPYRQTLELGRFVLLDDVEANAESWFLAASFRIAADLGLRGVVSFSDPMPRRSTSGQVVMPGHVGTIYQASNARYCGRSTRRTLHVLPDGTVLNARSLQKVRAGERGEEYVEDLLARYGAPARQPRESGAHWLARALPCAGVRTVRHPGNHRYAFAVGDRAARRSVSIAIPPRPYPKRSETYG